MNFSSMNPINKIILILVINVSIMILTLILTRRSSLPQSSKTLLYVFAVLIPILGLALAGYLNWQHRRYGSS